MDNQTILQKASEWMLARGWKRKVAKSRQFNQSLFEHTLVEVDAALSLLPILQQSNHFGLTEQEQQILIVSFIAHDVGKEQSEWQRYILGERGFLSDVDPELTASVLPELCSALGFPAFSNQVQAIIRNCVNLHMRHERGDANVVLSVLEAKDRWYTLANIVYDIDNICSAKGVIEAKAALQHSILANHLKTAYHQAIIRGVSTTALHRAALEAFREMGWIPLLHFSDATLYVCSAVQPIQEPSRSQIEQRLGEVLREVTGRDVSRLIVGSPTGTMLPKPELFDCSEIRMYLQTAAGKIGRKSFLATYEREKKLAASGKPLVAGRGKTKIAVIEDYWNAISKAGTRYSIEMDRDAERISTAHPDMLAFKFFKASMKLLDESGMKAAQKEYEAIFGAGSWADLLSTSTLMPAQDMFKTVDRFWRLPGKQFKLNVTRLEELAPETRTELLIDTLTNIADRVYKAIPNPPTRSTLARNMAASFVGDLISPTEAVDLLQLAQQQIEFYAASKQFAGRQTNKAKYLCPICNSKFEEGNEALSDFINKPESHTNRGIAHGPFGRINICNACYYERVLRQLLLGERASELILIFPRMNIGHGAGEILVGKTNRLYTKAYAIMAGETDDPDRRLWLAPTHIFAGPVLEQDPYRLSADEMVELLAYRSGDSSRKKNVRQLEKELKEAYKGNLEEANDQWGTDFASWDEATQAVQANKVRDYMVSRIRAQVYRLYPQMRLVCETPHLIMFPISYPIKLDNDSETNAALRRTFLALLLGLNLDASVAIVPDSEGIDFQGGEGVALVPPVPAVRELIGSNWVPINEAERWLQAIGLASILANAGQYSERSGLYEVLTAPTAGHVLRRIEQKKAAENLPLTYTDIVHLRTLEEVMHL